jgi:hypothetical protein
MSGRPTGCAAGGRGTQVCGDIVGAASRSVGDFVSLDHVVYNLRLLRTGQGHLCESPPDRCRPGWRLCQYIAISAEYWQSYDLPVKSPLAGELRQRRTFAGLRAKKVLVRLRR